LCGVLFARAPVVGLCFFVSVNREREARGARAIIDLSGRSIPAWCVPSPPPSSYDPNPNPNPNS